MPISAPLTDQLQRPLGDLRISLTDRCNLRCRYCMPAEVFGKDYAFLPREDILTYEEITRVAKAFVELGIRKIRLTGGEPLLRRNLPFLISELTALTTTDHPLDLALTTNGTLLTQKAEALHKAGLQRVTVSLDALDPDIFQKMGDTSFTPEKVIDGIKTALNVGLGVKINTVLQRGLNESEILPLVELARELNVPLRFIEFMDVGETNLWNKEKVIPSQEVREFISESYPLKSRAADDPAETAVRYYHEDRPEAELGFISSVTQPFCQNCSRARLSAEGKLFTCLFATQGHDLRPFLRSDQNDTSERLLSTLRSLWQGRDDRYSELRNSDQATLPKPEMSYIGG